MAQSGGSSLSGLSLTGTLTLQNKTKSFFKGAGVRSHFFWFDEQNCSLKYYRGRDTYSMKVNEPLGFIDLRYAKVTPGIANGYNNRQFLISINNQVSVLTAASEQEALNWIEKLQEKRGEYIKMSSAMNDSAQEQEKERKTFRPLNTKPGSVLSTHDASSSPPSVRKIINTRLMGACSPERHSMNLDHLLGSSPTTPITPLEHDATPLNPMERKCVELETQYLESRVEADQLRKELMKLTCQLDERDRREEQLHGEVAVLKEELVKINKPQSDLALENESLKDVIEQYKRSLKSLDEEINLHTLNQRDHDRRLAVEKGKVEETERELLAVKAKYIKLFSDKFKPTVQQGVGDEDDIGEETSNNELVTLLEQEGGDHPELKTYRESFEDQYGDTHDWTSGVTTQLYLCRQLYLHYTIAESEKVINEWVKYLANVKKAKGKLHLELPPPSADRSRKRELRNMLRRGLPLQFRTKVWSSLIQKVIGRIREVRDNSAGKGVTYYKSLLDAKKQSPSGKQIGLDLYRTLPSNVHFQRGGNGAQKLENVLLAYSLHNKNVSYCQGMNMVAAIGLLFLDEETDFWFMVAIIDKLMPQQYFSPGLLGAQADQAVIRELVASKLPRLHAHLQRYNIDVTLVTFNWFLTLFVDALPTETVVRILDCFLLEGDKVLFRMSLGILKINERKILSLTDPVGLFQFLKEVARHTYDIEALFQAAFVDLEPFPSRSHLHSRQHFHFSEVKEEWIEREKLRVVKATPVPSRNVRPLTSAPEKRRLVWETGCICQEEVWMACTENDGTHLAIINERVSKEVPLPQVSSRVICMLYLSSIDLIVLGTLDFHLHAIKCSSKKLLWSMKLNDSVLSVTGQDSLFAALADGCVAVVQDVSEARPCDDPLLVRIGSSTAVQCVALNTSKGELWCGCGKAVTVISTQTLEAVQSVVIPDGVGKVYKMELGSHGLWVSFKNSSVVSLYDLDYYIQLLQVDYSTLLPSSGAKTWEYRVTSLMVRGETLWLGAGSGMLFFFSVAAAVSNPSLKIRHLAKQSGRQPDSQFRDRAGSGGLLSSVALEDSPDVSHYDRRRRTMFGHTLRGGARKPGRSADVYKLIYRETIPSASKEPSRTLLNFPFEDCVVSCVNVAEAWEEGVRFWTKDTFTDEWVCHYLKTMPTNSQD